MASCEADLELGNMLVEVKYVDRSFRGTDFRQLLCYCGLRYFAEGTTYENVAVFNPLRGVAVQLGVEDLVSQASGRLPPELFQDMSYVLSSGEVSR